MQTDLEAPGKITAFTIDLGVCLVVPEIPGGEHGRMRWRAERLGVSGWRAWILWIPVMALAQARAQEAEPKVAKPEPGGPGLAVRHPGDRGIAKDPAVIYATGFEKGIEGGLKPRRKGVEILKDKKLARTGKACARITATRGKDTGGDLMLTWKKGVERCYVRFYCRFDKDTVTPHHFANMSGFMPTYK